MLVLTGGSSPPLCVKRKVRRMSDLKADVKLKQKIIVNILRSVNVEEHIIKDIIDHLDELFVPETRQDKNIVKSWSTVPIGQDTQQEGEKKRWKPKFI